MCRYVRVGIRSASALPGRWCSSVACVAEAAATFGSGPRLVQVKLGTSLRFLYPTGPGTYQAFKAMLDALPAGGFIERPMGSFDTGEQAQHVLEIAELANEAGMSALLFGDHHAVPATYANSFSPIPTIGRIMAVTADMPLGVVVLAPFYEPVVLAEQVATLAAYAAAPLVVVLVNGGNPGTFSSLGIEMSTRARRLEELAIVLRLLLAGEIVSFEGEFIRLGGVSISPIPHVPVEIWIGGTVPSVAERAARLGDGWLTGQNTTDADAIRQLRTYRDTAASHGRPARAVLRRDIHVAASHQAAHDEVDRILAEGYRGGTKDTLLVGSPDEVIERLTHYRALGFEEIMVRHITGDHKLIMRSLQLIGEHVIPGIADL